MPKGMLIVIAVAAIAGLTIVFVALRAPIEPGLTTEPELPQATANIDDAVNAFVQEAEESGKIAAEEDADASLVDWDSRELSNFGQSYNENEL